MADKMNIGSAGGRPRAELDLLEVFGAVMEERSMARAAARLAMTPSAVSHNVARLRQLFNDPLFVRDTAGVRPTDQAIAMWERISDPLDALRHVMDADDFDPASARFSVRLAINDMLGQLVLPMLFKGLSTQAPGLLMSIKPRHPGHDETEIARGTLDFAVAVIADRPPKDLQIRRIWQDSYICMHRKGHPIGRSRIPLAALTKWPRISVSPDGITPSTAELALVRLGLKRPQQLVASTFTSVPLLLADTDFVSIMPSKYVRKVVSSNATLAATPLAFNLPPLFYDIVWHRRSDRKPGHAWVRAQLEVLLKDWAQHVSP